MSDQVTISKKKVELHREARMGKFLRRYYKFPKVARFFYNLLLLFWSLPAWLNLRRCIKAVNVREGVDDQMKAADPGAITFIWPMLTVGLTFSLLAKFALLSPGVLEAFGIIYFLLLFYTLITILLDFNLQSWVLKVALIAVIILAFGQAGVPIVSKISDGILFIDTAYPVDLFLWMFQLPLLVVFTLRLIQKRFKGLLAINGNFVMVDTWMGKGSKETRNSYSVLTNQRDINEWVLGFTRKLVLKGKSGRVATQTFETMPMGHVVEEVLEGMLRAQAIEDELEFDDSEGDGDEDDNG